MRGMNRSDGDNVTTDLLYLCPDLINELNLSTIFDLTEHSCEVKTFQVDFFCFVDVHAITHVLLGLFESFVDLDRASAELSITQCIVEHGFEICDICCALRCVFPIHRNLGHDSSLKTFFNHANNSYAKVKLLDVFLCY